MKTPTQKMTIKECKPTIVRWDTLMAWDGTFIIGKEQATKFCIGKQWCNNLTLCLAMKEKLDRKHLSEVEDMLYDLMKDDWES